jgi:hypothetical protein
MIFSLILYLVDIDTVLQLLEFSVNSCCILKWKNYLFQRINGLPSSQQLQKLHEGFQLGEQHSYEDKVTGAC